jgi:excisionase family DNA binding protein
MKTKFDDKVRATYKIPEAAAVCGVGESAIRKAVKAKLIPTITLSRTILIPRAALHRWLDSGGQAA